MNHCLTVKSLSKMTIKYPKVCVASNQKVFISFYLNDKRYRLYNGKRIGIELNPNTYPSEQRLSYANVLASKVYEHLNRGGNLTMFKSQELIVGRLTDFEYVEKALRNKLKGDYSPKYKEMLQFVFNQLSNVVEADNTISSKLVSSVLDKYSSGTSFNTIKRHLNVLLNEAVRLGMERNPIKELNSRKTKAMLHKPFENIVEVLEDIKKFNVNLYRCCLITYGCLLQPHREVRELKWSDFTKELDYIKLSGSRNKSGRNRIVPVPQYVKEELQQIGFETYLFGDKLPNKDYFSTLWGRYKKQSNLLKEGQTLYSFRHSGAIDIFKRTGSLQKLQQAMGHSSLNVSLTYLRGLEIAELIEEDMLMI